MCGGKWLGMCIYIYTLSIHYNDIDIYIYIRLPYLFHKCVSWNREPSDTANPLRETRLEDRKIYHGFLMGKNTKKNDDLLGFNGLILGKNIKNMEENGGFSSEKAMFFHDTRNPHLY